MDGQFPIPQWKVYERNVDTRTNNHAEGVKSIVIKLKALTSVSPHPTHIPYGRETVFRVFQMIVTYFCLIYKFSQRLVKSIKN